MLKCRALMAYRNDQLLFDPVSFELSPGEALQVLGQNGAGKTTFLRTLTGILPLQAGEVLWNDVVVAHDPFSFQKELFYLGHDLSLNDSLSVIEHLSFHLACSQLPLSALESALAEWDLSEYSNALCGRLSCGQRKRVALLPFFLSRAKLFILDEPLSGLDQRMIDQLQQAMRGKLSSGASLIFTSHQPVAALTASQKQLTLVLSDD